MGSRPREDFGVIHASENRENGLFGIVCGAEPEYEIAFRNSMSVCRLWQNKTEISLVWGTVQRVDPLRLGLQKWIPCDVSLPSEARAPRNGSRPPEDIGVIHAWKDHESRSPGGDVNTERRAGSYRSLSLAAEKTGMTLMDRAATSRALSQELGSFARQQVSVCNSSTTSAAAWTLSYETMDVALLMWNHRQKHLQ
ncbi:hypothetical protein TNCV_4927861 [Trichonephila clavipes]|nr:hypothetical protein TNCV_4927861 [Trichonephila clavipes]